MTLLATILDIGNLLYFLGNIGQLKKSYQRRHELQDFSLSRHIVHFAATLCFLASGVLTEAYLCIGLNIFHLGYTVAHIYWVYDSKRNAYKYDHIRVIR